MTPVEVFVKLCNCAGCNRLLLGESMRRAKEVHSRQLGDYAHLDVVLLRVKGRPYCSACIRRNGWS